MIHKPIVHILLALQLALWSPVMCCCAIKATLGRVTGSEAGCCMQRQAAKHRTSCCAMNDDHEDSDTGLIAGGDDQSPAKPIHDNCRCHDRIVDRVQLNTGGKITIPKIAEHFIPLFLIHAMSPAGANPMKSAAATDRARRAPPSSASLHSQRCLFLI